MLNFRNTTIAFVILLLLITFLQLSYHWAFYWYFVIGMVYLLVLFYGSFYIGSCFYMPVYFKSATTEKKIAISFDDGPLEKHTPQILDILKAFSVKATFFCIGYRASGNIELLKRIHAEGHLIGNHSYYHDFWFDMQSAKKMIAEMQQMQELVANTIGVKMKWLRPPYGVTNPTVKKAAKALNYDAIGWNMRSLDTIIKDEAKLLMRVKKGLSPGAIFLFHDTNAGTVAILPAFLEYVKECGYQVVGLDKLLDLQPYE